MSDPKSRIFKRLIREYEFLLDDFKDVAEIHKQANIEMNSELNKHKTDNDFNAEHSQPEAESDEAKEPSHNDKDLKKLFRKIVFICHPDKARAEADAKRQAELAAYYELAVDANDTGNWALMVVVAIKLELELPEEAEAQVEKIQEDARLLKEKIDSITQSYVWQWYYAEAVKRQEMVDMYIEMLARSKQPKVDTVAQKEAKLILGIGHPGGGCDQLATMLQSFGLKVGHETMLEQGTVDWSLSTGAESILQEVNFNKFDWQHIIYATQDPKVSIPAIIESASNSFEFRSKYAKLKPGETPIVQAIKSIYYWNLLIQKLEPNVIFRVEDEALELFNYLKAEGLDLQWDESSLKQENREHKALEQLIDVYGKPNAKYIIMINTYCRKYGYSPLF